jgi:hypothetical protein
VPEFVDGSSIGGVTSGGGTAQSSEGGSAKGFNSLTSVGGLGSGSAQGNATGAIDGCTTIFHDYVVVRVLMTIRSTHYLTCDT